MRINRRTFFGTVPAGVAIATLAHEPATAAPAPAPWPVPAPAPDTSDYLFPIRDGRKFGFINNRGKVVVEPIYDAISEEHDGRIAVSQNYKWGYLDLSGKLVIPLQHEGAYEFRSGRAVVRNGDKYSLIDPAGRLVADIPYRVLGEFHQGLLRVQHNNRVDDNGKKLPTVYGFVDLNGKTVIPPQFMPAGEFPDNPADLPVGGLDRDWCYFDRTGKIIIRISMGPHLNNADLFANGRLRFKDGFTWGYKDATGAWAIKPKYNDAGNFKDGLAQVQDGSKWINIDVNGYEVPPDMRTLRAIEPPSEGLALATERGLYGWIDSTGKLAFPLRKYQKAGKFSNGLARICVDDLYGYLDRSGNLAIKNIYNEARDFNHGLAAVMTPKGTSAYINTKGESVWESKAR